MIAIASAPSALASPLVLRCGLVLGNRLVKSAMAEALATSHGLPTPAHARLYERWAAGGYGLLVTGNVMIDREHRGALGDVVARDDGDSAFAAWTAGAARRGVPMLLQLNHPGRQAPRHLCREPVAPSAVAMTRARWLFATPRALAEHELPALVSAFAAAAAQARRTGFAGVELHAAHGYLLGQFLSPRTNVRRDRYGGSPEARMRLLVDVVRAVRRATGPDFAIAVKLNAADLERGGLDLPASLQVAQRLDEEGIDLLEVTGGTYASDALLGRAPTDREPYFVEYVRALRPLCSVPLVLTGGHRDPARMRELVASGTHDLVGLARPAVLLPDLAARVLAGERPKLDEPRFAPIPGVVSALALRWYTQRIYALAGA